jgi:hypothetical protein
MYCANKTSEREAKEIPVCRRPGLIVAYGEVTKISQG